MSQDILHNNCNLCLTRDNYGQPASEFRFNRYCIHRSNIRDIVWRKSLTVGWVCTCIAHSSVRILNFFNVCHPEVFNTYINIQWCIRHNNTLLCFDVLLTVHLSIFISVINQLDAHNFCFKISLFHACAPVRETATYRCDDTRGCLMQFWPPGDEHMCSKHVKAWNKLIVKQKFCASCWLITEINLLCLLFY